MKIPLKTIGWALPLVVFMMMMLISSWKTPMWMDEWVFYKMSMNLPHYSLSSDIFFIDRPQTLNPTISWDDKTKSTPMTRAEAFRITYDSPIYPHNAIEPVLVYPFVKGLNYLADKGVIAHIEDQPGYPAPVTDKNQNAQNIGNMRAETMTFLLRLIPISLFIASMYFVYKILQKRIGFCAYFFTVPLAACVQLFTGAYLFYWDAFMMFFFVLTWYLMDRQSKWAYLTACLMINTKMFIPFLFLTVLMTKDWKIMFAGFSILPWWGVTVWVTHDPFYLISHYTAGIPIHNFMYTLYSVKDWLLLSVQLGWIVLFALAIPIFKYAKKYKEYVTLLILGSLYAMGTGMGLTHLSTLLYVGALVVPVVFYEYKLSEKLSRWLNFIIPVKEKVIERNP